MRELASKELDMELSQSQYKIIVNEIVDSYLQQQKEEEEGQTGEQEQEQKQVEEQDHRESANAKGDIFVCNVRIS